VYASEITGIRFLLKAKTRLWQFRQLRLSKGGFDEILGPKHQPAGAASEEASTPRKETQVVETSGSGVSGHPNMDAAVVESTGNPSEFQFPTTSVGRRSQLHWRMSCSDKH
jgi:hypothetical protein